MRFSFSQWGLPLLTKELLEQAQQKRTYIVRFLYCLVLYSSVLFNQLPLLLTPVDPLQRLGSGRILLQSTHTLQCFLIVVFMPVLASGVVTSEKERNTLQLLLLTRLTSWNIVLEKFLSRLLTMVGFLLMATPLLAVAYPMGGVSSSQVWGSLLSEMTLAVVIGSLSLACSAYYATGFSSLMMTYFFIFLVPMFGACGLWAISFAFFNVFSLGMFGLEYLLYFPPMILGLCLLLFARQVLFSRPTIQPAHPLLKIFRWLDGAFHQVNQNSVTRGIEILRSRTSMPEMQGVAWREQTHSLAGSPTHLMRLFCLMMIPLAVVLFLVLTDPHALQVNSLTPFVVLVWVIALLIVLASSTTLILKEKNRQTLEVLLSTPISTEELLQQKRAGVIRLMSLFEIIMVLLLISNTYITFRDSDWWIDLLILLVAGVSFHLQLTTVSWVGMMLGATQKHLVRALGIGLIGLAFAWWILPRLLGNLLPGIVQSWFGMIWHEDLPVQYDRLIGALTFIVSSPLSILEWGANFQGWREVVGDWPWAIVISLGYQFALCLFVRRWSLNQGERILQRLQAEEVTP